MSNISYPMKGTVKWLAVALTVLSASGLVRADLVDTWTNYAATNWSTGNTAPSRTLHFTGASTGVGFDLTLATSAGNLCANTPKTDMLADSGGYNGTDWFEGTNTVTVNNFSGAALAKISFQLVDVSGRRLVTDTISLTSTATPTATSILLGTPWNTDAVFSNVGLDGSAANMAGGLYQAKLVWKYMDPESGGLYQSFSFQVRVSTSGGSDTNAPTPNPMTFAVAPAALSASAVVMTATTATDPSGPVQYYFENTNTSANSGWSTSPVWTNTGWTPDVTYGYRVRARDAYLNATAWSAVATVTPDWIFNGGFELPAGGGNGSDATGWIKDGAFGRESGHIGSYGYNSGGGTGHGFYQTLGTTLVTGHQYQLAFWLTTWVAGNQMQVRVGKHTSGGYSSDGSYAPLALSSITTNSTAAWNVFSYTFTALGGEDTLYFGSTSVQPGDPGGKYDDVSLVDLTMNSDPTIPLVTALNTLNSHITGAAHLSPAQIATETDIVNANAFRFADNSNTISAVFDLVRTYDRVNGPLWIATGWLTRSSDTNTDLTWTIYHVMQDTMDMIYNTQTLTNYQALLNGFKFNSSSNFPGAVAPPPSNQTYTVSINGSFPRTFGRSTQGWDLPARKPTGAYLAPGTIATVTVPAALVGKGYQIRVGAHSWDMSGRPSVRRLDRATLLYDINATTTKVASPLGGGIYIEVPQLANAGVVSITITGAVRSPFFSATSFHQTSLTEWRNTERTNPGPWADFQSDKFMMQVPRNWIYALNDPVTLMTNWDAAMDACNDLMGFPHLRGKDAMYLQVDLLLRDSGYVPGYPTVNDSYSPTDDYGGNANYYLVTGPQYAPDYAFHEQGHSYFFPKFPGETESTINLLHVAVWNRKLGYSLDDAFRASDDYGNFFNVTIAPLDNTAVLWMTSFDFSPRQVAMASWEKAYQPQGHAKFVDIARLYGWDGLGAFWYCYNSNDTYSVTVPTDSDSLLLQLCKSVGKDVRPLFHFWGIVPANPAALQTSVDAANLKPPVEIYDLLVRYKSLLPTNNASYRAWCLMWYGQPPSINGYGVEKEHARQWSTDLLNGADTQQRFPTEIYDEAACAQVRARVQGIIDLYYPNGRPLTPPVFMAYGPRSGTSFPLSFSGLSNQTYHVLASTNVALPLSQWTTLSSGIFGVGGPTSTNYTDVNANNARRFYRIRSP